MLCSIGVIVFLKRSQAVPEFIQLRLWVFNSYSSWFRYEFLYEVNLKVEAYIRKTIKKITMRIIFS